MCCRRPVHMTFSMTLGDTWQWQVRAHSMIHHPNSEKQQGLGDTSDSFFDLLHAVDTDVPARCA